jgi:hypothetical protein
MNESGFPDGLGGLNSPDCPNYVPSTHELTILGHYWLSERWFYDMRASCGEPVDRHDRAVYELAVERLDQIGGELAPEVIKNIRTQVEDDFHTRLGERAWRIFTSGSAEEQERYRAELRRDVENAGPPKPAEVAELAVKAWPGLAHAGLADVLRAAAKYVETHGITNPLCGHDWQIDRQRTRLEKTTGDVIVLFDHCAKCHGERCREIHPGDPGYDEAKQLADGPE